MPERLQIKQGAAAGSKGAGVAEGGDTEGPRVTAIAVGEFHSCAVSADGVLTCWGKGVLSQIPER